MVFDESGRSDDPLVLALAEARRLLRPAEPADPVWSALAAAALFAICAMVLATTAILAPPPSLPAPAGSAALQTVGPPASADAPPVLRGPA